MSSVSTSLSTPSPPFLYFLRKEHPSVRRALPPVGWHRTCEQPAQVTTVEADILSEFAHS